MNYIHYRDGYKYQLTETCQLEINIHPDEDIVTEWILLNSEGLLTIMRGYAWDGPSGPMPDIHEAMRGSLVHDALYQLMREDHLSSVQHRDTVDKLLRELCIEDYMSHPMAELVYQAVHLFGNPYANPSEEKPTLTAP